MSFEDFVNSICYRIYEHREDNSIFILLISSGSVEISPFLIADTGKLGFLSFSWSGLLKLDQLE